ncbi:homoserine dehydrogenase [Actinomarinicola tropica]|uniref:Homoserine dehydrogenase n=1 Tax=Actinomarinicola tropica TaxID=2789776 RepID=A0A5Q2RI70_9ACTN|nr:homoserine dehydrogenase [Actinomarinicola tropica]QGG94582.1 homoserine dehydrogenase [Actinomarinicola tropica]
MTTTPVRIGLLGCGNVGAAFVQLVERRHDEIANRHQIDLQITRVAVRNLSRERAVDLDEAVLTHDADAVVHDPDIDLVVEVIGGIEPARHLTLSALKAGKPVISANKELLANLGAEIYEAAGDAGVDILFEAAVAGGIPLIRPLRESLAGEDIRRVVGIVNGTTNYVLSRMAEEHVSFGEALAEAQELGYAERDPTADVEGFDASAKAAIIASIAFGVQVVAGDVYREGIAELTPGDLSFAARLGYVVKLLAIAERFDTPDGAEVAVRVHPAMVPEHHPLAAVRESFNAVFVEGAAVGDLMFYGRGAGGDPTASAVLGDVIDAALNLTNGRASRLSRLSEATIRPIDDLRSEYYINMDLADRPGALATVAGVFGDHGVSIRAMEQEGMGAEARLVFITHGAVESAVQSTLAAVRDLEVVDRVGSVLRVVGGDDS